MRDAAQPARLVNPFLEPDQRLDLGPQPALPYRPLVEEEDRHIRRPKCRRHDGEQPFHLPLEFFRHAGRTAQTRNAPLSTRRTCQSSGNRLSSRPVYGDLRELLVRRRGFAPVIGHETEDRHGPQPDEDRFGRRVTVQVVRHVSRQLDLADTEVPADPRRPVLEEGEVPLIGGGARRGGPAPGPTTS